MSSDKAKALKTEEKKEIYRGDVVVVSPEEMEAHFARLNARAKRINWSKTHKPYDI